LKALLARVVEGTGPDRELDAEIGAAFRVLPTNSVGPNVLGWLRRWEGPFVTDPALPGHILTENRINWKAPPYTASLDAALTLVPDGWSWHVALRKWPTPTRATGSVWCESRDGSKLFYVDATTPTRALIAACLKARMEAQGE
jgi:hypothetical protein